MNLDNMYTIGYVWFVIINFLSFCSSLASFVILGLETVHTEGLVTSSCLSRALKLRTITLPPYAPTCAQRIDVDRYPIDVLVGVYVLTLV